MQHQNGINTSGITWKITNLKKKEDENIVGNWEKEKENTKTFSKTTRVDEPEPSEQVEPEHFM